MRATLMLELTQVKEDVNVGGGGRVSESRLFTPFKTLGLVSSQLPLLLRYIHKRRENFVITSTGRSLHTFVGQQLKLISTTEDLGGGDMTCLAGDTYHVYTASVGAKYVLAWRRGTELVHKYSTHEHGADVQHLLPFGENLISIDEKGGLCIFNIKTEDVVRSVALPVTGGSITAVMHPLTFQNKILIGDSDGVLHLWNINRNQLIHRFDRFRGSGINAIVQAPARGVVALALSDNRVVLFNIMYDLVLMELSCMEEPTCLAFRTDGRDAVIVGGRSGSISAWDLNSKEMIYFIKEAHKSSVAGIVAFMSEPIFVSSASDNAIRVWIFDRPDGGFRLLNAREGHVLPPTLARFHSEDSPTILTSGIDNTLRSFHLHNETYNRIISNFPAAKDGSGRVAVNAFFNYGGHHQPVGENIVAFNSFSPGEVYTFSYLDCKRGKSLLSENKLLVVTCAQITNDQQWAIVGFKSGDVYVYNLQSKRLKNKFTTQNPKTTEVRGLALCATESTILVGTTKDMSFHQFPGGLCKEVRKLEWPVRKVFSRPSSNLCGIVLGNFELLVCDVSTHQIIRRLKECCAPVTDATFSPDMKWLTAATDDGCMLTWDVPTGNLIDIFRNFSSSVTSLDYSPRGDFLVTTHAYEVGLQLWINKTVFEICPALVRIPPDYYPRSPKDVIPISAKERQVEDRALTPWKDGTSCLLSLGIPPKFLWKELLNLSTIKSRNKPAPAFKPKQVIPFLLSDFDKEKTRSLTESKEASPVTGLVPVRKGVTSFLSPLAQELVDIIKSSQSDCEILTKGDGWILQLSQMGPSQVDLEIRSWDPDFGGSITVLESFIALAQVLTRGRRHVQIVHTLLALFFKVYRRHIQKWEASPTLSQLIQESEKLREELLFSCSLIESLIEYSTESLY